MSAPPLPVPARRLVPAGPSPRTGDPAVHALLASVVGATETAMARDPGADSTAGLLEPGGARGR